MYVGSPLHLYASLTRDWIINLLKSAQVMWNLTFFETLRTPTQSIVLYFKL
jgi:hypothetical protein